MREIDRKDIRKVITVSKTHLDIGFTDYADAVMGRYVKDYIPKAVALADQMDRDGKKRFVRTTGSHLIQYALALSSQEDAKKLEDAEEKPESPENGLYFLLCNNRWGTNFPQRFGEDARFCYRITLKQTLQPAGDVENRLRG